MSKLGILLVLLTGLVLVYDIYGMGLRPVSVRSEFHRTQNGLASWYGTEEQGKLTANGERFDRKKFTAASRKLPFNTMVRVTNRENGRSVEVRINDRGPFTKNRLLDLSEAAAKALDMKKSGVTPIKIEVLEQAQPPLAPGSTLP
jgi:rare lipoprotein A